AGTYQVRLRQDRITDRAGNPLGTGTRTFGFTVTNVAPTLQGLRVTSPINENDVATLTGTIVDPGIQDTFTLTVNWGEGAPETFRFAAGTTDFPVSHRYLDDIPSGTASDTYALSVTITDNHGGRSTVAGHSGSSGPVRMAGVGASFGNRAADQVF